MNSGILRIGRVSMTVILSLITVGTFGQSNSAADSKVYKTLIVETVYPFSVVKIVPPERVPISSVVAGGEYKEPVDTLRAHFSAIKALDFDRFMGTWDRQSRDVMLKKDLAAARGSEYWRGRWRAANVGTDLLLLNRVEYGRYVIYQYQIDVGGKPFVDSIALIREDGNWKLTQELATDPILLNWNNPTGRVQVAPMTIPNK
jgi:hypothetical protein